MTWLGLAVGGCSSVLTLRRESGTWTLMRLRIALSIEDLCRSGDLAEKRISVELMCLILSVIMGQYCADLMQLI